MNWNKFILTENQIHPVHEKFTMKLAKMRLATIAESSQLSVAGPKLAVGVVCGHVKVDLSQFHCKFWRVGAVVLLYTY